MGIEVFVYSIREVDSIGQVLSDRQVTGQSCQGVLRDLKSVTQGTERIEVYNGEGEKAGAIGVDYWRQRLRRK